VDRWFQSDGGDVCSRISPPESSTRTYGKKVDQYSFLVAGRLTMSMSRMRVLMLGRFRDSRLAVMLSKSRVCSTPRRSHRSHSDEFVTLNHI
jgi:hypothetical protein